MPSVEVFPDLDTVSASAPATSGLPTREELEQWLIEQEKIEKETEIFDSGELKKFKKFTKGQSIASSHIPPSPRLNDLYSGLKAQSIPTGHGYHRAHVDDHI